MAKNEKKNQFSIGKIVVALILMALMDTEIAGIIIALAIPAAIGWIILRSFIKKAGKPPVRRQQSQPLDDCPRPICFHKDKGMHHVRRGRGQDPWDLPNREIDPWDRPDIDIRKYQRR